MRLALPLLLCLAPMACASAPPPAATANALFGFLGDVAGKQPKAAAARVLGAVRFAPNQPGQPADARIDADTFVARISQCRFYTLVRDNGTPERYHAIWDCEISRGADGNQTRHAIQAQLEPKAAGVQVSDLFDFQSPILPTSKPDA